MMDKTPAQGGSIKILIVAGGTGGHVFPGLAIAKELRKRGYAVEWLGTRAGLESTLVPKENIPLYYSNIAGVRGKGLLTLIYAPLKIYRAIKEAKETLTNLKPNLVLGLGGFVAGPGGIAARLMKIPLVIHEQNAVAGTTNRLLARFARRRLCAFEGALKKSDYVGNPVRKEIEKIDSPEVRFARRGADDKRNLRLLVLGGSRGAMALNDLFPRALAKSSFKNRCELRHQCGEGRQIDLEKLYMELGINAEVSPFIDNMAEAMAWADLVVCRAGALTVAELGVVGVGSVLIPFPYAIDDHQTANARFLERANAAIVKQQRDLSPEILAVILNALLADKPRLLTMALAARAVAKTGVASKICDICEEVLGLHNNTQGAYAG